MVVLGCAANSCGGCFVKVYSLQELVLLAADRLDEEDVGNLIKVGYYLFQVDVFLVEQCIGIIRVDTVKHEFLILNNISLSLLCHGGAVHINEQHNLCPREQLVNHDGDALAEVDLVLDVVLVLEALL